MLSGTPYDARAMNDQALKDSGSAYEIRTRVPALRGPCPGPLDECAPTPFVGGQNGDSVTSRPPAHPARLQELQYPDRYKARSAVNRAIQRETLVRPLACERCQRARRLDGHHDDYAKPLDVRWLCRPCHTYVHPHTQKNVGPVWRWPLQATGEDIAVAMAKAREPLAAALFEFLRVEDQPVRHIAAGVRLRGEGMRGGGEARERRLGMCQQPHKSKGPGLSKGLGSGQQKRAH